VRYNLNLSEAEYSDLTLAQFSALSEEHRRSQERQDFRAALICSVIANVNRDPKKRSKPYQPKDFMPGQKQTKKQSAQQMFETVKALNKLYGGKGGD